MSEATVTVIGAGVIGTSMGLALKKNEKPPHLIVHDKDPKNTRQAMKMGAFDKSEWNLINACEPADLIVLAIPGADIKPTLEAIVPYLKKDAIISDTNQTKSDIVAIAAEILPDHVHFVGGNPIVTAPPGPEHATADLFQKRLYCLTPSPNVLPDAVQLMEDFIELIGATPFYLDPVEHDGLMGGVNTLPILLSVALLQSVSQAASWVEMRKLAGGLFSQVTSGAAGDPDTVAAGLLNNKESNLRWLDSTIESLQDLKTLVKAGDPEALAKTLDEAFVLRYNWQKDFEEKKLSNLYEPAAASVEEPGMFQRMFSFGGLLGSRRGKKDEDPDKDTQKSGRR